ncbi:uncharacterized protein [Diadema setosum]|uniref:uncharacterized protein n=1 Tax=Diadema setosum TaxID=31175 RepID=UPI003B3BA0BA
MQPESPSVLRARRFFPSNDLEEGARSASLPPRNRVAFSGYSTLVPCSKEFMKSLNDMSREGEDEDFSQEKLKLPIITVLKQSECGTDARVSSRIRNHSVSCSEDESSLTSNNSASDDDEWGRSWTSLSEVGSLKSLQPRRRRVTKSESSECNTQDDVMSVRSDSHLICKHSKWLQNDYHERQTGSATHKAERFSRKDGTRVKQKSTSTPESPFLSPKVHTRRLSPLSTPQMSSGISQVLRRPYQSKSASNSPEQQRRKKISAESETDSAPTSPLNSPTLSHRTFTKRPFDIPHRTMPQNSSTSGNYFTNSSLNPLIAKVDTSSTTGAYPASCVNKSGPYSDVVAWNFAKRGGRVRKDAWRLSDLCLEDHSESLRPQINLEEEFSRLKTCRYLRGRHEDVCDDDLNVQTK